MLQLTDISKRYQTGELVQRALDGVSLSLRDCEFVSVLGPSGSGKTTLLNIVGGLDRYDGGELRINGVSTKQYTDRDWDAYRNHAVGFVFQSYHLIPHQSVLANVELALTIAGIPRAERRRRAKEALEQVGLGDQLHKRPAQMSGGQMQRVAIARALVNDPDILLADEPTGALDSETSRQIMELLRRVAEKRLVVMVTHNAELAEEYSTRIVRLRDGKIVDDTDPFEPEAQPTERKSMGRAKMSFGTSLALSANNLRTKKGRTVLTAFAGSIGIIGIALILSLSNGVNTYIDDIQRETMVSYPVTISAEELDVSGLLGTRDAAIRSMQDSGEEPEARLFADYRDIESSEALAASIKENNLSAFKTWLDDPESEIRQYLGENGVVYGYDVSFSVYAQDEDDVLVDTAADLGSASGGVSMGGGGLMLFTTQDDSGTKNFTQIMPGAGDELVSRVVTDSYELLAGAWPAQYDQAVLVLDRNNALSAGTLYQLGLMTADEYTAAQDKIKAGGEADKRSWDFDEILSKTFYLVPACDRYVMQEDGTFAALGDSVPDLATLLEGALELKISGVVRPREDAAMANLTAPVGYTAALTDYLITHADESPVVKAQENEPEINVLTGLAFAPASDGQKAADAAAYISGLGVSEKASLYTLILYSGAASAPKAPETAPGLPEGGFDPAGGMAAMPVGESAMAAALDRWLEETPDQEILLMLYQQYFGDVSYDANMKAFGKVRYDAPSSISIYADTFEDKESISDAIARYNEGVAEENRITYTDYVALLTGSITSIVDVISYVLIAFVAVSLVVSCIMIGIITHISVLERTREIGILRALGASKRNISQVFNAETVIIGLCSGVLGVAVSALLTVPINAVLRTLIHGQAPKAALPPLSALILVALSVGITVLGGLIPAKKAARKDPVIALRTE